MLHKDLKQLAKNKGIKIIQQIETTIINPDDCPIQLPVIIIAKDKSMKVICEL